MSCAPRALRLSTFPGSRWRLRQVDLFRGGRGPLRVGSGVTNFRPDYLRLRGVIDRLGSPTVMACTPRTATEQVARGDQRAPRAPRSRTLMRAGFDRPNLSFDVLRSKDRVQGA